LSWWPALPARALEELGVEGVQLKWPNDVLVHGRKLAGILVELTPGAGAYRRPS
jgi:BirA family biotin operon repressor/biotin-[acetyl-CoA-carboxylase] ligase